MIRLPLSLRHNRLESKRTQVLLKFCLADVSLYLILVPPALQIKLLSRAILSDYVSLNAVP